MTTPQGTKDWEKGLREKFVKMNMQCSDYYGFPEFPPEVLKFIFSELSSQAQEIMDEVQKILTDEIATAHTTTSGKTSRLTSAYNRISKLKQKYGK